MLDSAFCFNDGLQTNSVYDFAFTGWLVGFGKGKSGKPDYWIWLYRSVLGGLGHGA
jgi:hypothetical protein